MGKKPPFSPSNVDVTLTFGTTPAKTLPLFDVLRDYGGQPLYCHAQSDGTTLSLLIDDVFGGDVQSTSARPPQASNVTVTLMLAGQLVYTWPTVQYTYPHVNPLSFFATVSATLGTLHLRVNDAVSDDVPDPNHTKGIVSFVLVQQPGGEYQVVWIHDSEAVIPKAELLTDASVVPAEPPSNNGSITGPMGFTLP